MNEQRPVWFYWRTFPGRWRVWPDNVVEEDGDCFIIHDPPTNGLADKYNVKPYRYASALPGWGLWRWSWNWDVNFPCTWPNDWRDGQKVPRRVVNALAGYRDPAVVEVA